MKTLTRMACVIAGIGGIGYSVYDGVNVGKLMSRQQANYTNQKYLEKAYFNSNTIDDVSFNQNNVRKKVFNKRTKNPIPSVWGRIKGATKGFLSGLGANLPLVIFSSMALLSKNFMGKIGLAGTIGCGIYNVFRQGFGIGKKNNIY